MSRRPRNAQFLVVLLGCLTAATLAGCAPLISPQGPGSDGDGTNGQSGSASPAPDATETPQPETSASDLQVGDCYNADFGSDVAVNVVTPVDCAMPHTDEVYWISPTLEGDYPGQEALTASASDLCLNAFEAFIGIPFESSTIAITILYVSPEDWADPAKRHIGCSAVDMDANGSELPTTGTLKDAGR
jgi:hypothetical protein